MQLSYDQQITLVDCSRSQLVIRSRLQNGSVAPHLSSCSLDKPLIRKRILNVCRPIFLTLAGEEKVEERSASTRSKNRDEGEETEGIQVVFCFLHSISSLTHVLFLNKA